jgi:hypothetical protein
MTGVFARWELDAPTGSRPVLREAQGETLWAYSPEFSF